MRPILIGLVATTMGIVAAPPANAQLPPNGPIPTPGPELMVWQQGQNASPMWQRLGCPRPYESDTEKNQMIRNGECNNAKADGTIKNPSAALDTRPNWQRLGCPRDYDSDAEKEEMIKKGLCRAR